MKRLLAVMSALALGLSLTAPADAAAEREKWDTQVFASVPPPGYPAYVHAHSNGRVYAGNYIEPDSSTPSRVFEWSASGTLLRSWTVPRQHVDQDQGVQVANETADGRLVLLETSRSAVLTLNTRTGRFRRIATLPDLPSCSSAPQPCTPGSYDGPAVPNYATWGPGGLYVTDYNQAVIWKVTRSGRVRPWFTSPALDGAEFGTAGIRFRPGRRDLLITQQAVLDGSGAPTNGALYRLPITGTGAPGTIETVWTSLPGDLPDGFGVGRSGHIYIANAGLSAQLVELDPSGQEVDRFPDAPLSGENGSSVPFDTPCSATFLGRRVLVANQSAVAGEASHQVILDVYVGERGRSAYLPDTARFH